MLFNAFDHSCHSNPNRVACRSPQYASTAFLSAAREVRTRVVHPAGFCFFFDRLPMANRSVSVSPVIDHLSSRDVVVLTSMLLRIAPVTAELTL